MPTTYTKKSTEVKAVQWDGVVATREELVTWGAGVIVWMPLSKLLLLDTTVDLMYINENDYIIEDPAGVFTIVATKLFSHLYTEVVS